MDIKKFKNIQDSRIYGFDTMLEALEVVKKFIIKKKRILYGGMSIDLNLKTAGKKGIYGPEIIPDYDFYSPDPYGDANELSDELYALGFEGVKNHNAMHVSTRKVLIFNTTVVADISYMPKKIFDSMPTQIYQQLRFVHPNFQRMDQHRALSRPFDGDIWTVILYRAAKDFDRFKLLNEAYPIEKQQLKAKVATHSVKLPKKTPILIDGFAAYAYIRKAADVLKGSPKFKAQLSSLDLSDFVETNFECVGQEIKISGPGIPCITLMNDDYISLAKKLGDLTKAKFFDKYGDETRPNTIWLGELQLFDGYGVKYPCYPAASSKFLHSISVDFPLIPDEVSIVSIQRALVYFIQRFNDYGTSDEDKIVALEYYRSLLGLWNFGHELYNLAPEAFKTGEADQADYMPFYLSATLFGSKSIGADYIAYIHEKEHIMNPAKCPEPLRMPGPYHPEHPGGAKPYKYDTPLFQFDGSEISEPKKHIPLYC